MLDSDSYAPLRLPRSFTSTSLWESFQVKGRVYLPSLLLASSNELTPPSSFWFSPPGFGWGLVFTPMLATVMAHFTQRRTLALGISLSSVGLSSFAFNPLFQLLVEKYTWRGAILILGGLSLNLVPCGALIRPRRRSEAPADVSDALVLWRSGACLPFPVSSL